MYYKVIFNDKIVDVLVSPIHVRYQQRNDLFLICDPKNADGVISSDGSSIFLTNENLIGADPLLVTLEEIDAAEYNILRSKLAVNRAIDNNIEDDENIEAIDVVKSLIQQQLEEQAETLALLEDCILELSMEIFG